MAGKAGTLNIFINQHANFELYLTWKSGETPIDTTDCAAVLQIKQTASAPNALFEASTANGMIQMGGANGRIVVQIPSGSGGTSGMRFERGVYDLVVKLPSGTVRRLIEGEVVVRAGVSQFKA